MTQITQTSPNEQEIILQLKTLSPAQQRVVIDLIGALQVPAVSSQEDRPESDKNANIKINITQLLGKDELNFEWEGQVIYPLISEAIARQKTVVLSFRNVKRVSWSFITKAIGHLYEHFSESQIQSCLQLVDITEQNLEFLNHVIETKKEFLINPEKFRQPMSDEQLEELRQKQPNNPMLKVVGMFKNDETFDDMLAYIAEYRRELDEEYFRQIDAETAGS
ncbi:DUF4325 domain-containing protein [Microcoleus sp. A003_D6]|uniref:STAS-like domain-containing protein n=1 Tax=Microcoleus sp. A003_D6 TaxID=3055266 RepID=UPI002FD4C198